MPEQPKPKKAEPQDKRILILEDDDGIRDMLRMTLEGEGFKVKTARDGKDIANLASQFKPDLVLSDVMMPGGGGYEVLRALQADYSTRKTPVIIMTGYHFDPSTRKLLEQEPNVKKFVEKPIRPVAFLMNVHEILNTRSKDEKMVDEHNQQQSGRDPNLKGFDDAF